MKILITGGAGFIGSTVIRYILANTQHSVINIDKLTYASNLDSLQKEAESPKYSFEQIDICDQKKNQDIFQKYQPDAVMHLAAESHVDRSIDGPAIFIETNIIGTYNLLEASRHYFLSLSHEKQQIFRFHHISTDEVYGDLNQNKFFIETTPYAPSSPYSASKASSDHLVRAWHRTFGLPTIISNCSNNYGPHQFPEKLIPLTILNALEGKPLPLYGNGTQVRDWLYVEDHARALYQVLTKGKIGETYNIGGENEHKNIDIVKIICATLEDFAPDTPPGVTNYEDLIHFVEDRPGHDQRYAIDPSKIKNELGWTPKETFESGLRKTVEWYLSNQGWCQNILDGAPRDLRMGLGKKIEASI